MNIVRIIDGAIIMYHCSVKSGNGPFRLIQDRILISSKLASAKSNKIAVLKKVAMKIAMTMAVISPVSV